MIKPTLTPKQEKFCQQIVAGRNQSEAYRAAYHCKRMKPETVNSRAYELMKHGEIRARVKQMMEPVVANVRKTREDLLNLFQGGAWFDPRQMFDTHGNPHDIPALKDNEAMMLEGFEIVEEFSGKGADRVPVGYTRKFKLGDRHKFATSYGKMMGFITNDDEPPDKNLIPPRVEVILVDAPGGNVQVNVGSTARAKPKVHFVG